MAVAVLTAPSQSLEHANVLVAKLIGRPLRLAEQAIDVLRLDQALTQAKNDLEAAVRHEMLDAAERWIRAEGIGRVEMHVTAAMLAVVNGLGDLGRQEGLAELRRAGYKGIRHPPARRFAALGPGKPETHRHLTDFFVSWLNGISGRVRDDFVTADLVVTLSDASRVAIANALLAVPGARDLASRAVSTALIDGFGQTFEANQDLVSSWEYTAILDGGTCEECEPLDGTTYDTLDDLFAVLPNFGPNPDCLGEGRCRCRAVPAAAD